MIYKCHNTNSTEVACKGPGPGPGPGSGPTYSGSFLSAVFVFPSARLLACTGRDCVVMSRGVGGGGGGGRCHCDHCMLIQLIFNPIQVGGGDVLLYFLPPQGSKGVIILRKNGK